MLAGPLGRLVSGVVIVARESAESVRPRKTAGRARRQQRVARLFGERNALGFDPVVSGEIMRAARHRLLTQHVRLLKFAVDLGARQRVPATKMPSAKMRVWWRVQLSDRPIPVHICPVIGSAELRTEESAG